jgi:hypothetical protein
MRRPAETGERVCWCCCRCRCRCWDCYCIIRRRIFEKTAVSSMDTKREPIIWLIENADSKEGRTRIEIEFCDWKATIERCQTTRREYFLDKQTRRLYLVGALAGVLACWFVDRLLWASLSGNLGLTGGGIWQAASGAGATANRAG